MASNPPPAPLCPHLGQNSHRHQPPIPYPSFENECLAFHNHTLITLGDQATYCLTAQHSLCPRFQQAAANPHPAIPFVPHLATAEQSWQPESGLPVDLLSETSMAPSSRRSGAWLGAMLVFASVFLCAGLVASYTGWQWISRNLIVRPPNSGSVNTVSAVNPAVFIVQTATPAPILDPLANAPTAPFLTSPAAGPPPTTPLPLGSTQQFPAAVTPTPLVVVPPLPSVPTPQPAAPLIDVAAPIPTRRPTPIFDLPTSTPLANLPPPPPTPTLPPLGTPVVVFAPDSAALQKGQCTFVRWNVLNVREVYYENLPMNGRGEREECIDDADQLFTLLVIHADGSAQVYTTTVAYLAPTPTITPTPSFTPEPVYTPTWTPLPPTLPPTVPAPAVRYAVLLAPSAGTEVTCTPGQPCELGLWMTNSGDAPDTLVATLVQPGALPAQLCRPDGVCADRELFFADVGPGNTASVLLRVNLPADSPPQSLLYTLFAASSGSGGTVASPPLSLTLHVQNTQP